jgi:fucose 4-O-acetylase-like acetyltransferase
MQRDIHIDTLRGMACIFLVAYHVVGTGASNGLGIESGIYREASDLLAYVRMPLFTFLSGVVYAYRPFREGVIDFLKGKSRRLLIPMLVVGTIFAILKSITPGANGDIANWFTLHIIPVAHYWFLSAQFLIFMVMVPLEKVGAFDRVGGFFFVLFGAILLYFSGIDTQYFSISGAIYLFPFFLLGMGVSRFKWGAARAKLISTVLCLVSLGVFTALHISGELDGAGRTDTGLLLGSIACLALYYSSFRINSLAIIGGYSYSIYLFHVFFTAGTRILLYQLGIEDTNIVFVISMVMGVSGPIVVEMVLGGFNLSRLLFLGQSRKKPETLWGERLLVRSAGQ